MSNHTDDSGARRNSYFVQSVLLERRVTVHSGYMGYRARPGSRKYKASVPRGANPIKSDQMMLRTKPATTILTRPIRSAKPPMKTMKMPENRRRNEASTRRTPNPAAEQT